MTSKRRLKKLQGNSAKRAIKACLDAMRAGTLTSLHIRNAQRCEVSADLLQFEVYLRSSNSITRSAAAGLVVKVAPEKVVEVALEQTLLSEVSPFLAALEGVKCKDIDDLTALLHREEFISERVFNTFVTVGRADLLFGLAVSGDEKTTERVKRYLNEQGFI